MIAYDVHAGEQNGKTATLQFLLVNSWTAWIAAVGFVMFYAFEMYGYASLSLLVTAVLAMNGLAKTDIILAHRTPRWWREHWALRPLHKVNNEGEMAGILVGLLALGAMVFSGRLPEHVHWPLGEMLTLFGILSLANWIVEDMKTLLAAAEQKVGRLPVLYFGALSSSLTGEPPAGVFQAQYIKERVSRSERPKAATALAAAIGSGGGLLPFAAPPILIIWIILQRELGWSIGTLLLYVGVGCALHALISTMILGKFVAPRENGNHKTKEDVVKTLPALVALVLLVAAHILYPGPVLMVVDAVVGVVLLIATYFRFKKRTAQLREEKKHLTQSQLEADHEYEELREEGFTFTYQPLILGLLLGALELIGLVTEDFISDLAAGIPQTWPILIVGLFMFFLTAIVSHFADNALASRVFIGIALAYAVTFGAAVGSFLAAAIICGALFGGYLTIPANLPNFPIARNLRVGAGDWITAAYPRYWTAVAYLAWLVVLYLVIV